jgi:hypothetical protein
VSHARRRKQFEHCVQHAETCAKHRHDDDIARDGRALGGPKRRFNRVTPRRNILQRLGGQQNRNPVCRAAELRRLRPHVAQFHERVLNEGMIDEVNRHRLILGSMGSLGPMGSPGSRMRI